MHLDSSFCLSFDQPHPEIHSLHSLHFCEKKKLILNVWHSIFDYFLSTMWKIINIQDILKIFFDFQLFNILHVDNKFIFWKQYSKIEYWNFYSQKKREKIRTGMCLCSNRYNTRSRSLPCPVTWKQQYL